MEEKTGSRQEDGKKKGTVPDIWGTGTVTGQLSQIPVPEFAHKTVPLRYVFQ